MGITHPPRSKSNGERSRLSPVLPVTWRVLCCSDHFICVCVYSNKCPKGTFTNTTGRSVCRCVSGPFVRETPGRLVDLFPGACGALLALLHSECAPGTFAGKDGSPICDPCDPGEREPPALPFKQSSGSG